MNGYESMPENRVHSCHETNLAGVPVAWIVYEPAKGFELESTDAYGGGAITSIKFCPFCGERLEGKEQSP